MRRFRTLALCVLATALPAAAQLRDIDTARLPPDVAAAYRDLLPFNELTRNYVYRWDSATPQAVVTARFTHAFQLFQAAHAKDPDNLELALLLGLTGHLAYNLDIDSAYVPAVAALEAAQKAAPADPRPGWFLGISRCETSTPVPGMSDLLAVERDHHNLPADFWRDYALCAQIVSMPSHALRAFDTAHKLGADPAPDAPFVTIARNAAAPGDPAKKYPSADVWTAAQANGAIHLTSFLCGLGFATDPKSQLEMHDVNNGTCAVTITPPGYLNKLDFHTPTLAFITRPAEPGESLEGFADKLTQYSQFHAQPVSLPCPVNRCLAYEIRRPDTYTTAGGAHFLLLAFSTPQPEYPGLSFETPAAPPTPSGKDVNYFRPAELPHRFPGTMHTILLMDASEAIYPQARADFEKLLKSLVLDQ